MHQDRHPTVGPGGIDSPRSAHFGRAGSFTLVDVMDGTAVSDGAIMNPSRDQAGCAASVATLAEIGVQVAIVNGMAPGVSAAACSRCHISAPCDEDCATCPENKNNRADK